MRKLRILASVLVLGGMLGVTACTENTGKGAAVGAAAGAGWGLLGGGGVVGNAAKGAAVGAAGGYIYDKVKGND
jgi:osmotically inducible lipoprotein OsmB